MAEARAESESDSPRGNLIGPPECPRCGTASVIRDHRTGEMVCSNCGRVLRERPLDRGPEWRGFDRGQGVRRARGGAPVTYTIHDKGLSTRIDWRDRDSRGKSLSPGRRSEVYRLRKWQQRARISDAAERNLASALSELERMSSRLGLPRSAREEASVLYREAVYRGLVRGRSIEGVVSAAIYAACRVHEIPWTLDEIAEVSQVGRRRIGRSYRFISRELDLHLPPTDPAHYVSRFGSELEISAETRTKAVELIKEV